MLDDTTKNLEPTKEHPKFVEPYKPVYSEEIDLVTDGKPTTCSIHYAEGPDNKWYKYGATIIGDWLAYFDEDIVIPPDKLMYSIKIKPGAGTTESMGGYSIYTVTTLYAQQQIQNDIRDAVVLDLGSGAGIQALTSLKLGAKHAILYENNKKAIKTAEELLTLNGFGPDKYTIIEDTLDHAELHKDVLAQADIGIANIGKWDQYGDAHLQAANAIKFAPKMKYYIASGYPYFSFGDNTLATWNHRDKASGEDEIVKSLSANNFSVVKKVDGHSRGMMNCCRAFIARR